MKTLAPIVLFCYNRPEHLRRTLEALKRNDLSERSTLYIYCDGPKENASLHDLRAIESTRFVAKEQQWCGKVDVIEADKNIGLAGSIVYGVTTVVNKHDKVIVLEDDIVTSPGFLTYMNDALEIFKSDEKVMEVSAFMFPINPEGLPDTFFYNANSCWGWGTWAQAWKFYNDDIENLYKQLLEKKVDWRKFNAYQGRAFQDQVMQNLSGVIKTWAVKWHAVVYLQGGSILHPKRSLTRNMGFDGTGVHCGSASWPGNMEVADYIQVKKHSDLFTKKAQRRLSRYFSTKPSLVERLKLRIRRLFK